LIGTSKLIADAAALGAVLNTVAAARHVVHDRILI
jgi:hypothetical protein